jgi:maltose alpha-D-glucosyltransferase/alpha-amylase
MRGSAGQVLRQLRRQIPRLPEAIRNEASEIVSAESRLRASFGRLLSRRIDASKIRIHGDLHLGQVLNTGKDFVILDFEGEPRRSLGERLLKRSPLVDVAGMLRSFDYAAAAVLRRAGAGDAGLIEPWAQAWVATITQQFLAAYFDTAAGAAFLPPDAADVRLLLNVFVLEKAIYEVGYELSYRPDFLSIPLRAVSRLLREMD